MTKLWMATDRVVLAVSGNPGDVTPWVCGDADYLEFCQVFSLDSEDIQPPVLEPLLDVDKKAQEWAITIFLGQPALAAIRAGGWVSFNNWVPGSSVRFMKCGEVLVRQEEFLSITESPKIAPFPFEQVVNHLIDSYGDANGTIRLHISGCGKTDPLRVSVPASWVDTTCLQAIPRYYIASVDS